MEGNIKKMESPTHLPPYLPRFEKGACAEGTKCLLLIVAFTFVCSLVLSKNIIWGPSKYSVFKFLELNCTMTKTFASRFVNLTGSSTSSRLLSRVM